MVMQHLWLNNDHIRFVANWLKPFIFEMRWSPNVEANVKEEVKVNGNIGRIHYSRMKL